MNGGVTANSQVFGDLGSVGLYDVRALLVLVGVRGLGLCMRLMKFCNKRVQTSDQLIIVGYTLPNIHSKRKTMKPQPHAQQQKKTTKNGRTGDDMVASSTNVL